MEYLFIDESGSLTKKYASTHPYFVMCILRVKDIKNLRKILKKFIQLNYQAIIAADHKNRIFKNGSFIELKGSSLSPDLKHQLARYLCHGHIFEVYYIHINNNLVDLDFTKNPSLAFNYVLGLLLDKHLRNGNLPNDDYLIDIDQRNLQVISINSLEEYLNIELKLKQNLIKSLNVAYYDSKDNLLIQVSDFFSNLYFSYLRNELEYQELFNDLKKNNYIKDIFYYPKEKINQEKRK